MSLPQIIAQNATAVIAVLAFVLSLYNFYLQRRGKLNYQIFERVKKGLTVNERHGERVYTFDIRFFNEKSVGTGIRDCTLAFYKNGSRQFYGLDIFPKDSISRYRADALTFKSQEFVARTLEVKISKLVETLKKSRDILVTAEDVQKIIEEADKVVLEGYYPTGKSFEGEILRKDTE